MLLNVITNGVLLTKAISEKIGFKKVWIPVDGDKDIHDLRRPCRGDGTGSFEPIFNNIKELVTIPGIEIIIGVNFDTQNLDSIPRMLNAFKEHNLQEKLFVDFLPTVTTPEKLAHFANMLPDAQASVRMQELIKLANNEGFKAHRRLDVGVCGAFSESAIVIDPYGKIFRCSWLAGLDDFEIGNVRKKGYDQRNIELLSLDLWQDKECLECDFVPICAGGCRFRAFVEHQDYKVKFCNKSFYERGWKDLLKLYYSKERLMQSLKASPASSQ